MACSPRARRMLCIAGLLFVTQPGLAQQTLFAQPRSPRIANYDINVRLDAQARLLHGRETLHWRNTSSAPLSELQFHLYLNGFRNDRTTFLRESGSRRREEKPDKEGWGYIEIDTLAGADGENLSSFTSFIQPDDDNADDKSVLRLQLPEPLPAGESITLRIAFTAKLPEPPMARTGVKEEFVMAGQWFPKIGVYENNAWNCHQFHANSEFYADFGVYNVDITVPHGHIVGATGLCYAQVDNPDSTVTYRYHAEDVHDFAWTASPNYVIFSGKSQDVEIRALMQKDHISQGPRYIKAAEIAVAWFQDQYGDYPYPNLTVVDPRRGALSTGGMEYPTLITAGTAHGMPAGLRMPEMVILHEFGHNYWYHLVASNEFEEAWLDEGINTYSEIQIFSDTYGETGNMIDLWGVKLNDLQTQRMSYISQPDVDPILLPSWSYYSGNTYSTMSYSKPGLVLITLQNYLGRETMNRIMRAYFARWQFKHPHTADFIAVANEVSGQNLDWFFDQALRTTAVLDYSISRASSEKVKKPSGFDFTFHTKSDSAAGAVTDSLAITAARGKAAIEDSALQNNAAQDDKEDAKDEEKAAPDSLYETKVSVRRLGNFVFPVEVQMVFADGDTILEKWNGKESWKNYSYTRASRLVSATVDPEHKIPLDIQITNNSRTVDTQSAGLNKLTARLLFWTQFLFDMPQIVNPLFTLINLDL
jgi:hypothetical protein